MNKNSIIKNFSVKMKVKFIVIILILANTAFGQTVNPPKIESPNATSIDKFGKIPVNLFTGTPDISFPIHTLKYGNINVPIALRYHPGLVKPLSHPGWVGLGWNLECTGAITRIIHNYPDEFSIAYPFAGQLASYYPSPNNPPGRSGSADISLQNWNTTSQMSAYFNATQGGYAADVEADEFSFNFMGHSGTFYYTPSGWQVVSDENIQVILNPSPGDFLSASDIDNIISQYTGINSSFVSTDQMHQTRAFKSFTLIVPDGTKYIFGGADAVELYSFYGHGPFSGGPIFNVNTWLLKTIIDVNNNQVNFSYRRSYPTCDLFIGVVNSAFNCQTNANIFGPINNSLTSESVDVPSGVYSGNFHWPMYLSSITTPNETVNFSGGIGTCLRYSDVQLRSLGVNNTIDPQFVNSLLNNNLNNIQWEQLNSIIIKNSSNNIYRQYGFNYVPPAGAGAMANQRLCLYSFNELDKNSSVINKFTFYYNDEASLPIYDGDNTDHWGYYNGQSIVGKPVSQASSLRATNNAKVTTGLLTRISYPTGGYTKLTWEAHDYSQVVPPTRLSLLNQTGYAGGSRITDIANYLSDNTLASEKKYFYKRGYTNGSVVSSLASSGILNGNPQYVFNIMDRNGTNNIAKYSVHLESINPMSTYSYNGADSYIGYDEVAEVNADGSYSRHFFTSYGADLNGISHFDQAITGTIGWSSGDNYYPFATLEMERGKSVADYDYTSGNILLHKIQYVYRNDAGRFSNFVKRIDHNSTYFNGNCTYLDALTLACPNTVFSYSYYPVSKTETTYDQTGSNPVVVTENYSYNSNNLIATKTVTNSQNQTITTNYKYPTDYTNTSDPSQSTYQAMFASGTHIISPIVETSVTNTANSIVSPVSLTHINYYAPYAGKYMPQSVLMQVANNSIETRQQIFSNDSYGNIQEEGKPNGMHTVYLWGYNGEYPIAKIAGSTYSVVSQIVSQTTINSAISNDLSNNTNGSYLRAALAPLYANSSLSTALISTYTYYPLIGIASETDPRGFPIFYNYDAYGRLTNIQDADNNVLKRFDYSFSGPSYTNVTQSATFTKQGTCAYGAPPSTVYTVPAGTFTSFVDQTTADQSAISYMNTNGQAAANALSCPALSCSFIMSTGISSPSNSLTSNGTTANGYIAWYTNGTLGPGISFPIATINGSCKPSVNRYLTINSNGINWNVTIFSNGQVGVNIPYGSPSLPPNTTIYFYSINYNL